MLATYGPGLCELIAVPVQRRALARVKVQRLQAEVALMPQYEPVTEHYFHGGMYCRKVWRGAGVMVVGKVHKKEHFYFIVSGTVAVTTDGGEELITGPMLLKSAAGTKRAVYSLTEAITLTVHRTDAKTVEAAEAELIEPEEHSMFDCNNKIKVLEVAA